MLKAAPLVALAVATALFAPPAAAGPRYGAAPVALATFQEPELGREAEVELGQTLVSAGRLLPAIEVVEPASVKIAGNTALIAPGVYTLASRSDDGSFYRASPANPLILRAFGINDPWPEGGTYVPDNAGLPAEVYYLNLIGMVFHKPVDGLKFTMASPIKVPGGFRRDMLYGGVAKGVVTLNYREFVDDMARPAFSQALTYDLSEGDEIGFRGARIKIVRATNTTVRYVVLKPMSSDQ